MDGYCRLWMRSRPFHLRLFGLYRARCPSVSGEMTERSRSTRGGSQMVSKVSSDCAKRGSAPNMWKRRWTDGAKNW
jgi:hypothetical protein